MKGNGEVDSRPPLGLAVGRSGIRRHGAKEDVDVLRKPMRLIALTVGFALDVELCIRRNHEIDLGWKSREQKLTSHSS